MLYVFAHFIKDKCSFIWDAVEWGNAWIFSVQYKKVLQGVPLLLESISNDTFTLRVTEDSDAQKLEKFFAEQPEGAFEFFKPHDFDKKSIRKILQNKAFQTFVVTEHDTIVGYFFLRSFINGKCFRGRMADYRSRGKGVGKLMSKTIELIAIHEKLRMFASISPDNYASLNSAKAVSDVRIIKTLENGYYLIECTPKQNNTNQGGESIDNLIVVVLLFVSFNIGKEVRYAA